MTLAKFVWPTREEYDLAMQALDETVYDDEIRQGILAEDNLGTIHFGSAGLYTCMYKVDNWMIRCFRSNPPRHYPPSDIRERYKAIAHFCYVNMRKVSALVETYYIEPGINVYCSKDNSTGELRTFPIIKMRFLKAPKLGDFIAAHYFDNRIMEELSNAWLHMICELEDVQMAHGDLDLTNVLVEQTDTKLTLKLVDYDNVWIPPLAGLPQTEHGHKSFQHPAYWFAASNEALNSHRSYDSYMDRFSALVMYISLKALAARPELYNRFGADEENRLLLSADDLRKEYAFERPSFHAHPDTHLEQLYHVGIEEIIPCLNVLRDALRGNKNYILPRLDQIALNNDPDDITSGFSLPANFIWDAIEDLPSQSQSEPSSTSIPKKIEDEPLLGIQSQQVSAPSLFLWDQVEDLPSRAETEVQLPPAELQHSFVKEATNLPKQVQPWVFARPIRESAIDAEVPTEPRSILPHVSADPRPVAKYLSSQEEQETLEQHMDAPVRNMRDANETREIIVGAIALFVIAAIIIGIILFILWRFGIIFQPSHSSHGILPLTWVSQNTVHLFPIHHMTAPFVLHEKLL